MPVISGKNGNAKWDAADIPDVRDWELSETTNAKPYASSDTNGNMSRVAGQKDTTARVNVYNNSGSPIEGVVRPGDTGTLDLYVNATLYWSMPALCETLTLGSQIEGGDPNAASLTFGQTAAITAPA